MPIADAPDGTLWVQQVNVAVDVPEPSAPPTYDILEDIKDLADDIKLLLISIEGWAFDTLQGDVASMEAYIVPATQEAAGAVGRYSGTATTYQMVATWTVETGKIGELKEITVLSSSYSKTVLKITVGDIVYANDWTVQGAMPFIFEDLRLAAGKVVKVEAKSSDGTSITVDAVIVGKEIT